jgi:hypothetical protein
MAGIINHLAMECVCGWTGWIMKLALDSVLNMIRDKDWSEFIGQYAGACIFSD